MKLRSIGGITDLPARYQGSVGVNLDIHEDRMAYEQGVVDVHMTVVDMAYTEGWHDIASYGLVYSVVTNHTNFCINLGLWNSLPLDLQNILANKVIPEVYEWTWDQLEQNDDYYTQLLEEEGMIVHWMPEEERTDFRQAILNMPEAESSLNLIDYNMLELADHLRSEPYDEGPNY